MYTNAVLLNLKFLDQGCDHHVDWNYQDHDSKPSEHRPAQDLVEEEESSDNLKWCGPQRVGYWNEVHYSLSVH